jgi:hypothetical protein
VKPSADEVKAAIRRLLAANPNSRAVIKTMKPALLAGAIVRYTGATTLPEEDDNYDDEADDFDENHMKDLPQPTPGSAVLALIESGSEEQVVLWRGASPEGAAAIVANSSAGGDPADAGAAPLGDRTRRDQVGYGGVAPEYTSDPAVQGFSRDNWLIVVRISAKYLVKGSDTESGWIAPRSAPVEVLATVDRTRNKVPSKRFNAS